MKLKKFITGHLLLLVLVFSQTVSAEDFTANVPVDVSNLLPEVTTVRVGCTANNTLPGILGGVIGTGTVTVHVPANGAVNTTLEIKFNADPGENPANARRIICHLQLSKNSSLFLQVFPDVADVCDTDHPDYASTAWRCAKVGAFYKNPNFKVIP